MECELDRLDFIVADVKDLIGAVAFGENRLYQFTDAVNTLEQDIASVTHYRYYQLCLEEHRRIRAMLQTTVVSLDHWRILAGQYLQEISLFPQSTAKKKDASMQAMQEKIHELLKDLALHTQQLQQMQSRMDGLSQKLSKKKTGVPA